MNAPRRTDPRHVDPAQRGRVEEALRALAASRPRPADRAAVEELMTDAAAIALRLERERLLAKRRARAALLHTETDASAAREARESADDEARLEAEIGELRGLMARARRRFAPRL